MNGLKTGVRLFRHFRHLQLRLYRFLAVKPDNKPENTVAGTNGNLVFNALKYVQKVDEEQKELEKTPDKIKAEKLMARIEHSPELLFMLAKFHYELAKIGIDQTVDPTARSGIVWRYRLQYLVKYLKLHNIFWEQCRGVDVAERSHSLRFDPKYIGVLDPTNFSPDTYKQLQAGRYKDTPFGDIEMISFDNPFKNI